jgi:hypothetical protein
VNSITSTLSALIIQCGLGKDAVGKFYNVDMDSVRLEFFHSLVDNLYVASIASLSECKFYKLGNLIYGGTQLIASSNPLLQVEELTALQALAICDIDFLEDCIEKGNSSIYKRC